MNFNCYFKIFSRAGGVGLWYPDIINRISSSESSENMSICSILRSTQIVANTSLIEYVSLCNVMKSFNTNYIYILDLR